MKRLLLAGVLSLIGAAPSFAQVTSINAVGYVNATIPPGFSMIANQLNTANNTISSLIPNPVPGMKVYKFDGTGFSISSFIGAPFNAWNPNGNATLNPGEGAFIFNPTATNITVTFVGEVLTGDLVNPVPAGFSIRSSQVPQGGPLSHVGTGTDSSLKYVPVAGDKIYRFNGTGYDISTYIGAPFNAWNPSVPTINVSESFYVFKLSSGSWTRSFSIQ